MISNVLRGDTTVCELPIAGKVVKCGTSSDLPIYIGIMILLVVVLVAVAITVGLVYTGKS